MSDVEIFCRLINLQMANNSLSDCLIAQQMTANWQLILILFIKAILDLTSLIFLGVYGHCYITNRGLHPNLRVIMASLIIAFWSRNFLTFIRSSQMITRALIFHITQDNCTLLSGNHFCGVESVVNATPIEVVCWSFLVVTVERAVATIFYKIYEKMNYVFLAFVVAAIPWGFQFIRSLLIAIEAINKPFAMVPYCSSLGTFDFFALLSYLIPIAIGTCIISLIIYYANRKADIFEAGVNGSDYLTRRFQRIENMEATKSIAILCVMFFTCYISYFIGVNFIGKIPSSSPLKPIVKEAASMMYPIHGTCHVLLALYMSENLREKFMNHRLIVFLRKRVIRNGRNFITINKRIAPLGDKDDYFNLYKQQWL